MTSLNCGTCRKAYPSGDALWRCPCGGLLSLDFTARFPVDEIRRRKPTMWRYREAIPIDSDAGIVSFEEGFTPLMPVDFSGRSVLVKQDHLFPTGSYKDRGASVLISKAKDLGIGRVVEDSSGNAGSAMAAYCARAGIGCDIYVPAGTSEGKLAQIRYFGANLHRVPGTREDTARVALEAAGEHYYASHSWNPFFFQGVKTFAFEVCEQMGWRAPDSVILPAGNGTLLLGAFIGFGELLKAGVTGRLPRLVGVQASGCAPLAEAFRLGLSAVPAIDRRETVAEGIAIAEPIRAAEILEAVRNSGGHFITVEDGEIEAALKKMGRMGYYIEPTAAATAAGVSKYLEASPPGETIVSVFSGHGLKTTEKMLKLLHS